MLIWLKAGAWREGVSELFKAIRMELQSLQPQDSSTIKWNKTSSGMTAHVVDTPVGAGGAKRIAPTEDAVGGGDASYKGYFAVVDDSDLSGETPIYRVKVIDSASENEYSTYYFDYKPFNVNNITLPITGSCSIVLHVTTPVDTSSNPTAEMVALETVPASDEDNIYYVLAEVALTEGIMTIKQRHMGNAMLFWIGDC